MATYRIIDMLNDGLPVIRRVGREGGDTAIWSAGKLRKDSRCVFTGEPLSKGEVAYRPIGNQMYRSERMSTDGMDALRTLYVEEIG